MAKMSKEDLQFEMMFGDGADFYWEQYKCKNCVNFNKPINCKVNPGRIVDESTSAYRCDEPNTKQFRWINKHPLAKIFNSRWG